MLSRWTTLSSFARARVIGLGGTGMSSPRFSNFDWARTKIATYSRKFSSPSITSLATDICNFNCSHWRRIDSISALWSDLFSSIFDLIEDSFASSLTSSLSCSSSSPLSDESDELTLWSLLARSPLPFAFSSRSSKCRT